MKSAVIYRDLDDWVSSDRGQCSHQIQRDVGSISGDPLRHRISHSPQLEVRANQSGMSPRYAEDCLSVDRQQARIA